MMWNIFINRYFRAGTSGSTSLTGDNSQAKDVIIAGYDVQGFLGVRPAGQVVLHQQDQDQYLSSPSDPWQFKDKSNFLGHERERVAESG